MIRYWVELSGENPGLGEVELSAVVEELGGRLATDPARAPGDTTTSIELPEEVAPRVLAERLALARRVLGPMEMVDGGIPDLGARPVGSASFRPIGHPSSSVADPILEGLVAEWKARGGTIRLVGPERSFWYRTDGAGGPWLAEQVAEIDRRRFQQRRMPKLPFRRPVSLSPRLGRVAANLAGAAPGRTVVDPFLGTGALLAEAALLGARVGGTDRDPAMVRGALENFRTLGLNADALRVADAGVPFPPATGGLWDAILTDPPYGRSSGTHGEPAVELLDRTISAWTGAVRTGGLLALVVPTGRERELGPGWELLSATPDRVHRSLTREFRRYRRRSS